MLARDPLGEKKFPEFAYGSVWLMGAEDQGELSPLALHALGTADAVIHDPAVSPDILELVQPPRYREAALPAVANERALSLTQDGWRIVRLIEGNPLEQHDAIECAARCAEHGIPLRIIPLTGEPFIDGARTALLIMCGPRVARRTDPPSSEASTGMIVVSIVRQGSEERLSDDPGLGPHRRQEPLRFSMSGLAG
jgi:hypothetical protein